MSIGDSPSEAASVTVGLRDVQSALDRPSGSTFANDLSGDPIPSDGVTWWQWTPDKSIYVRFELINEDVFGTYEDTPVQYIYVARPLQGRGPTKVEVAGEVESLKDGFTWQGRDYRRVRIFNGAALAASVGETYYIAIGAYNGTEGPSANGLLLSEVHPDVPARPLGLPRWINSPAISPDGALLAGWFLTRDRDTPAYTYEPPGQLWLWVGTNEAVPRTVDEVMVRTDAGAGTNLASSPVVLAFVSPTSLIFHNHPLTVHAAVIAGALSVETISGIDGYVTDVDASAILEYDQGVVRRHAYAASGATAMLTQSAQLTPSSQQASLRLVPGGAFEVGHYTAQKLHRLDGTEATLNVRSLVGDPSYDLSAFLPSGYTLVGDTLWYPTTHDGTGAVVMCHLNLVSQVGGQHTLVELGADASGYRFIKGACTVAPGVLAIVYGASYTASVAVVDLNQAQPAVVEQLDDLSPDTGFRWYLSENNYHRAALLRIDDALTGLLQVGQNESSQPDRNHWFLSLGPPLELDPDPDPDPEVIDSRLREVRRVFT